MASTTTKRTTRETLQSIAQIARSMKERLRPQARLEQPVAVAPFKLTCPPDVQRDLDTLQAPEAVRQKLNAAISSLISSYERRFAEACYERAAISEHGPTILNQLRSLLTDAFSRRAVPMIQSCISRVNEAMARKAEGAYAASLAQKGQPLPHSSTPWKPAALSQPIPHPQSHSPVTFTQPQGEYSAPTSRTSSTSESHTQSQPISQPGSSFQNPIVLTNTIAPSYPQPPLFPEHLIPQVDGFNTDYTPFLLHYFSFNAYPSTSDRTLIAAKAKISARQVEVWFQNRRRRLRKEGREAEIRRAGEWESSKKFIEEELPVFQLPQGQTDLDGEGWERKRGSLDRRRYSRNGDKDVLSLHTPPPTPPSSKFRTLKEIDTTTFHFDTTQWPSPSSSSSSSPMNINADMKELRKQFMLLSVAGPREQQLLPDAGADYEVGAARAAITVVPVKAPLGRGRVGGGGETLTAKPEKKRAPKRTPRSVSSSSSMRSSSSSSRRSVSSSSSARSSIMPQTPPDAASIPLPASFEGYKDIVDVFGTPQYLEQEEEEVPQQQQPNLFDIGQHQIDFHQSFDLYSQQQQSEPQLDFQFDFDLDKMLAELNPPPSLPMNFDFNMAFDPATFDSFPLDPMSSFTAPSSFMAPPSSYSFGLAPPPSSFGMPPSSFDLSTVPPYDMFSA